MMTSTSLIAWEAAAACNLYVKCVKSAIAHATRAHALTNFIFGQKRCGGGGEKGAEI
jgi:hypothetical protein